MKAGKDESGYIIPFLKIFHFLSFDLLLFRRLSGSLSVAYLDSSMRPRYRLRPHSIVAGLGATKFGLGTLKMNTLSG